jgi:Tfp pilus assembly protein PilF
MGISAVGASGSSEVALALTLTLFVTQYRVPQSEGDPVRYFDLPLILLLLLTACTAQAQEPVSGDDFSQRAISRFEKNDLEGAIADFTKAIALHGQQPEFCFYFRGIALYRRGRLDDAIADLSKAITLKQHPRFYDDRGNLLAQRGDFEGALADLNRAIELEPKFAKAYGDRGIVHVMRGEDTAAELDFKRCFELDRRLEPQITAAANHLKQQAVLRAEHRAPADVAIVKFSWTEAPAQVLHTPAPVISVATTPVSQSGTRILADPNAKDQPGPPPLLDPSSTALPTARKPDTSVRGVDLKFTASIKNTGGKTIESVQWAYLLVPQDAQDGFVYVFTTKIKIAPGQEKTLKDGVPSLVLPSGKKAPTAHNRGEFKERVVILRLDYADGSSWRSSGRE